MKKFPCTKKQFVEWLKGYKPEAKPISGDTCPIVYFCNKTGIEHNLRIVWDGQFKIHMSEEYKTSPKWVRNFVKRVDVLVSKYDNWRSLTVKEMMEILKNA